MNTDYNNLGNGVGTDSLGTIDNPMNNVPTNNVGEETFSPFQDLNNSQLNVPSEAPGFSPEPTAIDNTTYNAPAPEVVQPAPMETMAAPTMDSYAQTPAPNIDALNGGVSPEPLQTESINEPYVAQPNMTNQANDTFQATQSVPTIDSYDPNPIPEAVQNVQPEQTAPKMEVYVQPQYNEPVQTEAAPTQSSMGLNDYVSQNTTQMPVVNDPVIPGPSIPIPEQMPTVGYQAEVSTPVDYATPMSDFDQIGTTPELDPNVKSKKSKKGLLAILLLLVIGGLGFGAYYLINVKGILNSESVTVKEVTAEKGEALSVNIEDYATFKNITSSNCALDTTKVNISELGTYDFVITCGDKKYTGKVNVKDTKAPVISVKTWIATAGTALTPDMFVNGSDEEATYQFASDEDQQALQSAGLKTIKINATDALSNSKTYAIPVVITSYEYSIGIAGKKNVTGDNMDATIMEKDVILYSSNAGMVNDTSYTAYIIKFNEEATYKSIAKSYDGSGTFTYETFTGVPVFYNNENTIVLVKDINTELIKEDYSATLNNFTNNGYEAVIASQYSNKDILEFNKI